MAMNARCEKATDLSGMNAVYQQSELAMHPAAPLVAPAEDVNIWGLYVREIAGWQKDGYSAYPRQLICSVVD